LWRCSGGEDLHIGVRIAGAVVKADFERLVSLARWRRVAKNITPRPAEDRRKNKKDEKLSQEKLED